MAKKERSISGKEAAEAEAMLVVEQEMEALRSGEHDAGTIAGRAPTAAPLGLRDDDNEENTGSPGADADREQAEHAKDRDC